MPISINKCREIELKLVLDAKDGVLSIGEEQNEKIQTKRKKIWDYYYDHLKDWAEENGVRLPIIPSNCDQVYHMFNLLIPSLEKRTALINRLKQNNISAVFHYLPLHLSDMGKKFGGKKGDCPVTEDMSDRLIRLPFYTNILLEEQLETIHQIQ